MPVVVFEFQSSVELMAAFVEVIRLQVHSLDSEFTTSLKGKVNSCSPNSLLSALWRHIKLIDETVASVKFERKSKAQHHVSD